MPKKNLPSDLTIKKSNILTYTKMLPDLNARIINAETIRENKLKLEKDARSQITTPFVTIVTMSSVHLKRNDKVTSRIAATSFEIKEFIFTQNIIKQIYQHNHMTQKPLIYICYIIPDPLGKPGHIFREDEIYDYYEDTQFYITTIGRYEFYNEFINVTKQPFAESPNQFIYIFQNST